MLNIYFEILTKIAFRAMKSVWIWSKWPCSKRYILHTVTSPRKFKSRASWKHWHV